MFNMNNWKEQIYKEDVKSVLLNGFLMAFLGGLLGGLIDYLFVYRFELNITIGIFLIAYIIVYRVSKVYFNYHVLYPTLSIVFMLFGLYIANMTQIIIAFIDYEYVLKELLTSPRVHFSFITDYYYNLKYGIKYGEFDDMFWAFFNIVMLIWSFVICYRGIKGRN